MTPRPIDQAPTDRAGSIGRIVAIAGLLLLGLGAIAGGITLVTAPDGSAMGFSLELLEGSPFSDYLVPGLVLGGLFGVGSFVVAWLGWRRHAAAPFLAFAIGCAQMIWIVVQLAIIGTENLSFLHPAMFLVGLVIAVAAVPWGWPTFSAWRAARA
jgi:energy-converting hydrogenase Eha subunit B